MKLRLRKRIFNVFSLPLDSRIPDFRILGWDKLNGHFRWHSELEVAVILVILITCITVFVLSNVLILALVA
ncbi:MAG: hypothetical protein M2R45_04228 [Verrucomicrobia subdivision 3 bacterium]|nr:hypothetical protein [Limisphaerales bacterium]MCS1417035.1 hypothetical protein [Limisphaerales bacterium]